jgi:hypothetical protein
MQAYSEATKITYPDFDALVQAESYGYTVCAVITKGTSTWPWMVGLYPTKRAALRAAANTRAKWRRSQDAHPNTTWSIFVRPVWQAP